MSTGGDDSFEGDAGKASEIYQSDGNTIIWGYDSNDQFAGGGDKEIFWGAGANTMVGESFLRLTESAKEDQGLRMIICNP